MNKLQNNPFNRVVLDRRSSVSGGFLAAAGIAGVRSLRTRAARGPADNTSVLISDLHVGANRKFAYTQERLIKVVDAILAMDPKPDNVICSLC